MTIKEFAKIVQEQQVERAVKQFGRPAEECLTLFRCETSVIPGKKYTKVNVGHSGKFMIDAAGNIFGIKGYGVIHKGHHYGNLETVNDWYWGNYSPVRKGQL